MKIHILSTLRNYDKNYLKQDIFSGIIIAAVSIPISMGYAQISGLPAVYGLYGSVLPILLFAIFSTSRQFIFGVDAAPAALAGSALLTLGITPGSREALNYLQGCGCSFFILSGQTEWSASSLRLSWVDLSAVSL